MNFAARDLPADSNLRFWRAIADSRRDAANLEEQMQRLSQLLKDADPGLLVDFQRVLEDRANDAYRWDLWAVAYIVNGGCSDDGFYYFRGWLIAQGRDYFETALADPERAADRIEPDDIAECEEIYAIAPRIYEAKTGRDDFFEQLPAAPRTVQGTPWNEETIEALFPDLVERFS